jgi:transcriptional regulator with PAS, ATPase and Fis domain
MLRAECLIASRQFPALFEMLTRMQDLSASEHDRSLVDLLRSHGDVLAGRVRESVRTAVFCARDKDLGQDERARALRILGLACYRTGHYRWAKTFLRYSASVYRIGGSVPELIQSLNSLSLVCRSQGRMRASLDYLDEAASLLPKKGFAKTRLRLTVNRGICLLKLGRLSEARSLFSIVQSSASEQAEPSYAVMAQNNLGHVYRLLGNHAVAAEFHERALALAKQAQSDRQVCLSLEFLGETRAEEGKLQEALGFLNQAHDLAKRLAAHGDLMMEVLRRRGEVYASLGDEESARQDLEKALSLCKSRGEKREAVLARRALALLRMQSHADSAETLRETLAELDRLSDRFEYARTVYLILKDGRLNANPPAWLEDAVVAAKHYVNAFGSIVWRQRLEEIAGHQRRLHRERGTRTDFVASQSRAYQMVLDSVRVAARSPMPALIVGETGAGKEVVARLVHEWSDRAKGPLVAINCGALPESLVESELFGYVQGAFTGAGKEKPGLFEAANGGTVLLDEIGDLPLVSQVKLLRFLDTGELRRVGEVKTRKSDVRVLASTNSDLGTLVREKRFRDDLLFRLKAFRIAVPPLRERTEDILDLARSFLREGSATGPALALSSEVEKWLLAYQWPGNIRELRSLCGYLSAKAWGRPEVTMEDIPDEMRSTVVMEGTICSSPFEREKWGFERNRILKALRESKGSISGAARLLGMSRNTVSLRMRRYGLKREPFLQ